LLLETVDDNIHLPAVFYSHSLRRFLRWLSISPMGCLDMAPLYSCGRDDKIASGSLTLASAILKIGGLKGIQSPSGFFCFFRCPRSSQLDAVCLKSKTSAFAEALYSFGRDDKIRTCDPLHPMQVRYRAALRPENPHFQGCEGKEKPFTPFKNSFA
jgi:hypothetical protein